MRKQHTKYDDDQAKIDIPFIFLSLIAAAGAGVLAYGYYTMENTSSLTLVIGCTFLIFTAVLLVLLLVLSLLLKRFQENVFTGWGSPRAVLLPLLGVVVGTAVLAGAMQLLYGLNIISEKNYEPTSQIFLVDNSASMGWNDPDNKRFDAIQKLIQKKDRDFPYMIYSFGTDVQVMREMGPANDTSIVTKNTDNGAGTNVELALTKVYDDYTNGVWQGGKRPQVVMITDGENIVASNLTDLLNKYAESNIPISTVHLIAMNSEPLMLIANQTGGQFVKVENVDSMEEALETAMNITESRSLLDSRVRAGGGIGYGLLRILFLSLLGCLIGFGALLAYGRHESGRIMLISTPVKAVLAATLFELLSELASIAQPIWVLGLFVLLGTSIVAKMKEEEPENPKKMGDYDDFDMAPRRVGTRNKRRKHR